MFRTDPQFSARETLCPLTLQKASGGKSRGWVAEDASRGTSARRHEGASAAFFGEQPALSLRFAGEKAEKRFCHNAVFRKRRRAVTPFVAFDGNPVQSPGGNIFDLNEKIRNFTAVGSGVHADCSADGSRNSAESGCAAESVFGRKIQQNGKLCTRSGGNPIPGDFHFPEFVSEFQKTDFKGRVRTDQIGSRTQRKDRNAAFAADRNH